jgi:hypothetical protein
MNDTHVDNIYIHACMHADILELSQFQKLMVFIFFEANVKVPIFVVVFFSVAIYDCNYLALLFFEVSRYANYLKV